MDGGFLRKERTEPKWEGGALVIQSLTRESRPIPSKARSLAWLRQSCIISMACQVINHVFLCQKYDEVRLHEHMFAQHADRMPVCNCTRNGLRSAATAIKR